MSTTDVRIAILGASGYTGAELVRLLAGHPRARIVCLTADRQAGRPLAEVFPQLAPLTDLPPLVRIDDVDWDGVDMVFCALPHGTTQSVIAGLPDRLKVVDLSADFRLFDPETYAQWYGHPHQAVELQKTAVYGLTEIERSAIARTRLVANPGCYTTTAQLPLVPLLEAGLIDPQEIVIDAKSGVSGAGRGVKDTLMYAEVADGIHAYSVASHRHAPEIDQTLTKAAGTAVEVSFTPHLVPMNRGILATTYVKLTGGASAADLRRTLADRYGPEPFVHLLPEGQAPQTRHVRGSNHCLVNLFADRRAGRAILLSVTDNLVKGASGQAIQNMNVMLGLPETQGIDQIPAFP